MKAKVSEELVIPSITMSIVAADKTASATIDIATPVTTEIATDVKGKQVAKGEQDYLA